MTYIWNRAERIPAKSMPKILVESFSRWQKKQLSQITEDTSDIRKQSIFRTIRKQKQNLKDSIDKFNRNNFNKTLV
mgnify:CR=1 FL=1|jgi:hypothetical protein